MGSKPAASLALLAKLPRYWTLPRRERESVRCLVDKIEQHRAEQEAKLAQRLAKQQAEVALDEWMQECAEQDVGEELPFSLSVRRTRAIQAYADTYQDTPQFQANPARFYKVYQRAFRSSQRLFREERSTWDR